jgi:hypothetical protein
MISQMEGIRNETVGTKVVMKKDILQKVEEQQLR